MNAISIVCGHETLLWMSGLDVEGILSFRGETMLAIPSILMGVDRSYLEWSL